MSLRRWRGRTNRSPAPLCGPARNRVRTPRSPRAHPPGMRSAPTGLPLFEAGLLLVVTLCREFGLVYLEIQSLQTLDARDELRFGQADRSRRRHLPDLFHAFRRGHTLPPHTHAILAPFAVPKCGTHDSVTSALQTVLVLRPREGVHLWGRMVSSPTEPAQNEVSNAVFVENAQQFFEAGVHRFRRRRANVHRPPCATPRRRSAPHPGAASTQCRTTGPSRKFTRTVPSRMRIAAFPKYCPPLNCTPAWVGFLATSEAPALPARIT